MICSPKGKYKQYLQDLSKPVSPLVARGRKAENVGILKTRDNRRGLRGPSSRARQAEKWRVFTAMFCQPAGVSNMPCIGEEACCWRARWRRLTTLTRLLLYRYHDGLSTGYDTDQH